MTEFADDCDELPWVSIVTPAYNQAEYLAETIESVLAQDYPRLEYIVIDDGSTDGTQTVLQRYEGRLHHERHANMGQARTINKGWRQARGSLIAYLSSDDTLAPGAITRMVKALQDHPNAVVAYCDFGLIDARGSLFRQVQTEDFSEDRLHIDLVCQPGPGALIRRDIFDGTGGWAEGLQQVPDFEFWLRASCLGPFVRVAESLANYRVHQESASYRAIPSERAQEIFLVMSQFWHHRTGKNATNAIARSLCIVAKNHAQSGRIIQGIRSLARGFLMAPTMMLTLQPWRQFLFGIIYRHFGIASVIRRFGGTDK